MALDLAADYLALEGWLIEQARAVAGEGWRVVGVPSIKVLADEPAVPTVAIQYEDDKPEGDARSGRDTQHLVQTWRVWVCVPYVRDPLSPQATARGVAGPLLAALILRFQGRPADGAGNVAALSRQPSGTAEGLENGLACYPLRWSWRTQLCAGAA